MFAVAKFGGSSVCDAEGIRRCCDIIESEIADTRLVIVSATYQTTNRLEDIKNDELEKLWLDHQKIALELELSSDLIKQLEVIYLDSQKVLIEADRPLSKKTQDKIYATGELWSSLILFGLCQKRKIGPSVIWLDARKVIKTDNRYSFATPDRESINSNIKNYIDKKILTISQGFIGEDTEGQTTTLGREGSDYSASLFAEAIDADYLTIWSDVPGVATSDPRLYNEYKIFDHLDYDFAAVMAERGAKVLFPKTMQPLILKQIPVYIKSSLNSSLPGTIIDGKQATSDSRALTILGDTVFLIGRNIEELEIPLVEVGSGELFRAFKFIGPIKETLSKLHDLVILGKDVTN